MHYNQLQNFFTLTLLMLGTKSYIPVLEKMYLYLFQVFSTKNFRVHVFTWIVIATRVYSPFKLEILIELLLI